MLTNLLPAARKFFRIYEDETSKVLLFALLGAVLQCGISVGVNAADALFLNHRGSSELPIVYLLSPLVVVAYIACHTFLISRIGVERVLDLTLIALAGLVAAIAFLLNTISFDDPSAFILYYAAKLTTMVGYIALYTLYWNVTDSYFNILDAKRLFAYLSAGCALGAAAGGALVHSISDLIRVEEMFFVWALLSLISYPVSLKIRKKWKKLESEAVQDDRSFSDEVKNLARTYRGSSFAIFITASLFTTLVVSLLCEFQYYGILANNRTDSELASLLGRLSCAVSVLNLIINLFVFNRLVEKIGVRNLALLQSITYIAVFSLLVVEHTEFAAVLGFFAYHGFFISIDGNNFNLLLNALPSRERKQLRTFIEGACEPLAHAFVGGALVLAAAACSPAQISSIGLVFASVSLLIGLSLRSSYVNAMVENLRSRWLDFSPTNSSNPTSETGLQLVSSDILRILALAPDCTPSERRVLEARISALGSRAVPGCVKALEAEELPLRSRTLAARALSRIAFPQLESMSQRIVNHTLCKAYDTFIWEHQVSSLQLPHELNSLAQRLSKDRRDNLIEFMLELLTLSGRLASFEPLAASLRSNEAKSRGTAIETIEQACSSELKRLLRPLLDAREADRRLPIARELHPLGPGRIRARIIRDTESLDDLEAAFALELLAHLDLNYAAEQSRIRLADFPAGLSHVVGVEVIARAQNEESDSIFQRAGRLMAYAPTKDLDLHTLLELSQADCDIAQNQGKARPSRLLTVSKSEVRVSLGVKRAMPESSQINLDLDTLVERSRRDATLARNLYQLIRTSDGHAVA